MTFWMTVTRDRPLRIFASSQLTGDGLVTAVPVQELLSLKPQLDLPLCPFRWITGMNHIPLNDRHTFMFYLRHRKSTCNIQKVAVSRGCRSTLKLTLPEMRSNGMLPADVKAEISSDCACQGLRWVRMAHHCPWRLDYLVPFPHLDENKRTHISKHKNRIFETWTNWKQKYCVFWYIWYSIIHKKCF